MSQKAKCGIKYFVCILFVIVSIYSIANTVCMLLNIPIKTNDEYNTAIISTDINIGKFKKIQYNSFIKDNINRLNELAVVSIDSMSVQQYDEYVKEVNTVKQNIYKINKYNSIYDYFVYIINTVSINKSDYAVLFVIIIMYIIPTITLSYIAKGRNIALNFICVIAVIINMLTTEVTNNVDGMFVFKLLLTIGLWIIFRFIISPIITYYVGDGNFD